MNSSLAEFRAFGIGIFLVCLVCFCVLSCDTVSGLAAGGEIVFYGEYTGERFGHSLDFVGDVNDDGFEDIAVGAPSNSLAGADSGMVYLFFGPFDASETTRTPAMRILGFAGTRFGTSITGGFDVNGDGISDFAVSSQKSMFGALNNGDVFVFYGDSSSFTVSDEPREARELSNVIIKGLDTVPGALSSAGFGMKIGNLGDIDRDGVEDIGVGAPSSDYGALSEAGALFIFLGGRSFGEGTEITSSLADYIVGGTVAGGQFATSFDFALNLDGQGNGTTFNDDFAVGAPGSNRVYVFLGPASRFLPGLIDAGVADRVLEGDSQDTNFGISLTHLKDIDGDDLDDLAVRSESEKAEKVYLYYGRLAEAPLALMSLVIEGSLSPSSGGVASFSAASGNLAFGATQGPGGYEAGAVFIFEGERLGIYSKYSSQVLNVLESSKIINNPMGLSGFDDFASVLQGDRDINGDGYEDLLIGAQTGNVNGEDSGFVVLAF